VVDYSTSGDILFRGTDQGYSNSSTWTRGQAWVIYGYTLQYRYTRDLRMLAEAQKVADYYLQRLGGDAIPNWDFDAPTQHKDTSAAAAVASALYELSGFVEDASTKQRYLQAAERTVDALASPSYLAEATSNPAVLLHGSADVPRNRGVDAGLIYGDYFFLEALARRPPAAAAGSANAASAASSAAGGGCASTGSSPFVLVGILSALWTRRRRRGDSHAPLRPPGALPSHGRVRP
jgi:unsaturated chondroitin disaccharide hydrolase